MYDKGIRGVVSSWIANQTTAESTSSEAPIFDLNRFFCACMESVMGWKLHSLGVSLLR